MSTRKGLLLAGLLAFVAVRVGATLGIGPAETPDSGIYIGQSDWFLAAFSGTADPAQFFGTKGYGYGVVIALFRLGFGADWPMALVLVQTLLSIAASLAVGLFLLRATGSRTLALTGVVLHGTGIMMEIDPLILRDSLFSSLLTLVLAGIATQALESRRPGMVAALAAGVGLALAYCLREQLVFYMLFFVPLVLLWIRRGRVGRVATVGVLLAVFAPLVLTRVTLIEWRANLTGEAVISTNAGSVMLQAVLETARANPALFDGGTPLDEAANRHFRAYSYAELLVVRQDLSRAGIPRTDLADAAIAKYLEAWRRFPLDMLGSVAGRFFDDQFLVLARPGPSLSIHLFYRTGDIGYFKSSRLFASGFENAQYHKLLLGALDMAIRPLSAVLYLAAWAGLIWFGHRAWRGTDDAPHERVALYALAAYGGLLLAHAMVHIEPRHLAGVVWAPLCLGLLTLVSWRRRWAARGT